ncbi:putative involucrin repeat protein [Rosellinia necatrix]|uniref:Putative involucrin repeat protein n=1 Tax=Rosellinia necatrix TaxID=77044 RepID=A0A1W2TCJ5_ROSNE|nr:putative involucrin repeat protein [Rosellinia necatrix]
MDGFAASEQDGFDVGRAPMPRPSFPPNGSALVDSYRQDALNGFEKERPRTNPMNSGRIQSSVFVDLKDSVQVHLLTETALFDSKEYMILSEDEVDSLKKQCQTLTQRIEQARSNLTIQSKYRDAAVSVSRLYSPTGRRSLLGNRLSSGSDAARETEAERDAIQKKCEDLAAELWSLEQRLMEPQKKLLEHTAGILQHAHKTAKKTGAGSAKPALINGVPASPESMYTTSHGRNSLDFLEDGFVFDEASLYRSFDMTEILNNQPRQAPIGIPLKSPVREQNKQLVEETDKLRQENDQVRRENDEVRRDNDEVRRENEALVAELELLKKQTSDQWDLISGTEQKLEKFNHQLREAVIKVNPTNDDYDPVPTGQREPGGMLNSHLDYLGNTLLLVGDSPGNGPEITPRLQALNSQLQGILASAISDHPRPPPSADDAEQQLAYLERSLRVVDEQLHRVGDVAHSTLVDKQKSEQAEAVLMGLWDIIQSGYADIRQRKQERRNARMDKGLEPDEEDLSDADSTDVHEPYSLPAFSSKVQWLYTQATRLNEQKFVLKRQIKQQRELNSKSDSEKDQQLHDKDSELEETNLRLGRAEREADGLRLQLSQTLEELEALQNGNGGGSAAIEESHEELKQRDAKITSLEAESKDMQARLATTEASIEMITAQLKEATDARDAAEKTAEERGNVIKAKEQELEQMTGMVAELKMETAMTKAELDGAYGSRKQRAAEVAALQNTSQSARMQSRVEALEQELMATANDLSDVVKQSIESEKKIGELEDELDKVKAERDTIKDEQEKINEDLERQLHDATSHIEERMEAEITRLRKEKEQIQDELDKQRFNAGNGTLSPSGVSKTSYLTDSYRVGLRAERKKYEEQLRAEQMMRRKIEDELRALKRTQGPGKSPLSPR